MLCRLQRAQSQTWEDELHPPGSAFTPNLFELTVQARICVGDHHMRVSALIDTGCRIPLLIRTGLVPKSKLCKAKLPIKIVTADNSPMDGGTLGCLLDVFLPIRAGASEKHLQCRSVWAYECFVHGSDLIIGYPYLKINRLSVDCPADALRHTTLTNFSRSQTTPKSHTHDFDRGSLNLLVPGTKVQEQVSRCPIDPPGPKANDPRPQDIRATSSYLAATPPRHTPTNSLAELVVHPQQPQFLSPLRPGSPRSGLPVADPPSTQLLLGLACTTTNSTTTTAYKCSQCNRVSNRIDFDCGCVVGDHTLLPVTQQQVCTVPADMSMLPSIPNVEIINVTNSTLDWWDELYFLDESAIPSGDNTTPAPDTWYTWCPFVSDSCIPGKSFPLAACKPIHMVDSSHQVNFRRLRTAFRSGNYRIRSSVFQEIVDIAEKQDVFPDVDAFSSQAHCRLPEYWSAHTDAFKKTWSNKVLWINPPIRHLSRIMEKIMRDNARGVILVPVRQNADWFRALAFIAVDWIDLPSGDPIFEDPRGRPLSTPPGMNFRAVIFDALDIQREVPEKISGAFGQEPSDDSIIRRLLLDYTPRKCSGVIESASPHPRARELEADLRHRFDDVMEKPVYAKDIDPRIRGPFGIAKIELKEGAKPLHKKFFRCSGEREDALKAMIEKFISRGWIVPSKSEWTSQAFVVPKPSSVIGQKQWRLVLDYRYLNSQTKDDPFPLPLIEDLITKQSVNRIWSIFDLEDGFHQMHLHPESQEYTAFVTPHGVYQWTVLPMGVKNGPAMFQRMIQWSLRDLTHVLVYIDDILVGTADAKSYAALHRLRERTRSVQVVPQEQVASVTPTITPTHAPQLEEDLPLGGEGQDPSPEHVLELHFQHVCAVLTAFRKHKLFVKGSKMHLFMEIIKFCGHILSYGQRRAAPSKLEAIRKWIPEIMTRVTHLKQFLGLAQYYAIYMRDFAKIAVPLSRQLKNRSAEDSKVVWDDEMRSALESIKRLMLENVVLHIPNPYKPYVLEVDSSDYAVGGVLSQQNELSELRPVAFFSRKLQGEDGKGQVKWSIREKETYAIVLILQKFRSWVASSLVQIVVKTDHESLQHWYTEDLNKATSSVGRRCRWHEFLSQFNLVVMYVPGHTQKVADPLSRAPWYYPGNPDEGDATFTGPMRQKPIPINATQQKTCLTLFQPAEQQRLLLLFEAGRDQGEDRDRMFGPKLPLPYSFKHGTIVLTHCLHLSIAISRIRSFWIITFCQNRDSFIAMAGNIASVCLLTYVPRYWSVTINMVTPVPPNYCLLLRDDTNSRCATVFCTVNVWRSVSDARSVRQ